MSSDADSPRQRTVAELLAAHGGDTVVTGRRARRRAAEDASGAAAVLGEAPVNAGRAHPNGNAPYANGVGSDARPAGNGSAGRGGGQDTRPAGNGSAPYADGVSADSRPAPYRNGSPDARPARQGNGTPHGNGSADSHGASPMQAGGDSNGAPNANGSGDAYGSPYGNGAPGPRLAPPTPRRSAGLPDDLAVRAAHPDSDAPFVNGGAVYADTEAISYRGGTPWIPDRSVLREPVPVDGEAPVEGLVGAESAHRIPEPWSPLSAEQARARPTEQMPRLRSDRTPMLDAGLTGPIEVQRLSQAADVDDEGPPTAVGMAPAGAEDWHRARTSHRASRDGGPPTEAADPIDDALDAVDDAPAGLSDAPGRRRSSPVVGSGSSAGQAWAAVVAQWIAGAIGGAALWVGFRFLWRDLPVVALAAAALVTVGLVLVVRALMRNDDRRTTIFAVLVGLLLTVSPAILVLLGR